MTEVELPPHDELAEESLVSCAMQSPAKAFALPAGKTPPEAFYVLKNRIVWSLLKQKHELGEPIDLVTVMLSLKKDNLFDNMGGAEWLTNLEQKAPTVENIGEYADVVMDKFSRRKIIQTCSNITERIKLGEPLSSASVQMEKLLTGNQSRSVDVSSGDGCAQEMVNDLQRRFDLGGKLSGISTGFRRIDSMTDGLQYGEQTIIGARPSMGKTAIGLNIFQNAVFEYKVPSLFISLEMSTTALMKRLLSSRMDIPMSDIRRGSYTKSDFAKFSSFKMICEGVPMHVANAVSGASIGEIASIVRNYTKHHGVKLVVIDYLQKIKASEKQEKKTYEIGDVSGRLKAMAVDTGAAFLTLAQLNRESEKDKGRMPRLSDLADSGQIERDGDTILLIHRDRADTTGATKIIVGKQRDGEVGIVDLTFNGKFCRFENPTIPDSDVP